MDSALFASTKASKKAALDQADDFLTVLFMTATAILDLKQRLSKLSENDRRMAAAYLLRLKHESPAGRREATRAMKEMDEGRKFRVKDLAKQLGHA